MEVENVVLEGGGVKCFSFIGCLKYLEENKKDFLPNIKRVIGSSAGSLFAFLIACKKNYTKLEEFINEEDFSKVKDDTWGYVFDFVRIINYYGMCKGDELFNFISRACIKFTSKENITFKELYDKTNVDLIITGTNLNKKETEYFSYRNNPNMEIRMALRISMSIPLFFKAVNWNGDIYVDGGLLNNYPIWYFDNFSNSKTLGFKLMSMDEKIENNNIEYERTNILNIKDYIECLVNCTTGQIEKGYIKKDYWERSIVINTGTIDTVDFSITQEDKKYLIDKGYEATKKYFEK